MNLRGLFIALGKPSLQKKYGNFHNRIDLSLPYLDKIMENLDPFRPIIISFNRSVWLYYYQPTNQRPSNDEATWSLSISPSYTWLRDIMVVSDGEMVEDGQQHLTAQLLQALRLLVGRHPLCHLTTGVKYWAGDWAEKRPLWAENSWKMRLIWWIDMYLQLKNRFYIEDLVSFERNRNIIF